MVMIPNILDIGRYRSKEKDISNTTQSSMPSQKSAYENLIDINNNLSAMVKESFAEIDNICYRVRTCLLEANSLRKPENIDINISSLKHPHQTSSLPQPITETAEDEANDQSSCDDITTGPEDDEPSVDIEEQEEITADIVEENEEEQNKDVEKKCADKKTVPKMLPFFTVLQSNCLMNSVGMKKPVRRITKRVSENFQTTMEQVKKLQNYDELMTDMVDDINKEIHSCYSDYTNIKAALLDKERNEEKQKVIRPSTTGSCRGKPCSRIEKIRQCYELKRIQKDLEESQLSENDLNVGYNKTEMFISPGQNEKLDFTYPDVYRKRAITNLNGRLIAQVEANDSLIFFQKLMAKTRKHTEKNRTSTFAESNNENCNREKSSKPPKYQKQSSLADLSKKYHDSLWFKQNINQVRRSKKEKYAHKKKKGKSAKDGEKLIPQSYTVKSSVSVNDKLSNKKPTQENDYKVTVTNNQPLAEPDRCKMHWMRSKYFQMTSRKLKYLDILDDITTNDLIPIKSEYPRRDVLKTDVAVKDSYLYKLMYGKNNDIQGAWSQFFEASTRCSKQNCKQCVKEVVDTYCKPPRMHALPENKDSEGVIGVKNLSQYIFGGDKPSIRTDVYTIMPVQVYYDNFRVTTRKKECPQKLPLLPMKECKENVKKASWTDPREKSKSLKVVYDPILRKIDQEIKIATARKERIESSSHNTSSWSPKNFAKYSSGARSVESRSNGSTRKEANASTKVPNDVDATKRSPKTNPVPNQNDVVHPLVPPLWNMTNKNENSGKPKVSKLSNDSKGRNDQQRKLWENKYKKSVGQKLISFVDKQSDVYSPPIPKYALPKYYKDSRQEQMLKQLLDLKKKNDNVQNNIQKAIEVIELKMIDIISKPITSKSVEAFEQMEKEITSVLNLMRASKTNVAIKKHHQKKRIDNVDENNEDIQRISQELFERLDKILESPTLSSAKSSRNNLKKDGKAMKKRSFLNAPSNNMNKVCFSSTSASGEEKFTITGLSPNRTTPKNKDVKVLSFVEMVSDKTKESPSSVNIEALEATENLKPIPDKEINFKQPETLVNLALIEDINPAFLEDSKVPETLEENLSVGDALGHGDFETLIEVKAEANLAVEINEVSAEDKDKRLNTCEEAQNNGPDKEVKALVETTPTVLVNISTTSVELNTETMYFTPQASPIGKLRDYQEGQNAQITNNEENEMEPEDDEFSDNIVEILQKLEDLENVDDLDVETSKDTDEFYKNVVDVIHKVEDVEEITKKDEFYNNVTKIIRRVEDVYSQLDKFEEEVLAEETQLKQTRVAVFTEEPEPEIHTESFLTPFMYAVTEHRKHSETSSPRSVQMGKSPSYFNVLNLLDNLTDFTEERPVEVYSYRICPTAFTMYFPVSYCFSVLYNFSCIQTITELPKKRSGCLKNSSNHSNINSIKSKQKVSFLLEKESKSTQVTPCPFHFVKSVLPELQLEHVSDNVKPIKVDQEASACLDVKVSKSVDKMSLGDEESYQTTFEMTDEFSSEVYKMSTEVQNIQLCIQDNTQDLKKNVVEIFRNSENIPENAKDNIKVFYDDYKFTGQKIDLKVHSGFYNDKLILEVHKSQSKTFEVKKRDSLKKLIQKSENKISNSDVLKESSLLKPLKDINQFIDSSLLKESIEKRQKIRMMRRRSSNNLLISKNDAKRCIPLEPVGEKEGILKGIYVFVYLLMFTALNLEFKCVQ